MNTMSLVLDGFIVALQPLNVVLVLSGVSVGTVVGMLPGIGPINAIAILLPVVFASGLPAASALILLVGIYYGSQYGNSISTILLNVPGTASAVVTAIDGYEMTKKGGVPGRPWRYPQSRPSSAVPCPSSGSCCSRHYWLLGRFASGPRNISHSCSSPSPRWPASRVEAVPRP